MRPKSKMRIVIITLFISMWGIVLVSMLNAAKTAVPGGPYQVGVRIERIIYQNRDMRIMIWYPARNQQGTTSYVYNTKIEGSAVMNALPLSEQGPYPLLIFSHGFSFCGCQSIFYTENLASFGYVVVAPDHYDSATCHIEGKPDIPAWRGAWAFIKSFGKLSKIASTLSQDYMKENGYDISYRSEEIKAVISQALLWNLDPASFLKSMLDSDKIGMTGHSMGGAGTLMVGGVPFDCNDEKPAPESCDFSKLLAPEGFNSCCLEYVRELKDPFMWRDKRIKAILSLAPPMNFPNLSQAAADLDIPVMIISGDSRRMEVPWEPIETFYTNVRSPKYLVRLKKTHHMTIIDSFLATPPNRFLSLFSGLPAGFAAKAQAYKEYSVAFFDLYLKGEDSLSSLFKEPSNQFAELWAD